MTTSIPAIRKPDINIPAVNSGRKLDPVFAEWITKTHTAVRLLLHGVNGSETGVAQAEADAQTGITNAAAAQATADAALPKAGGTMTGPITVANLTTVQKNALTAANGMIVYDTTLGKFQGYEAGAWVNLV